MSLGRQMYRSILRSLRLVRNKADRVKYIEVIFTVRCADLTAWKSLNRHLFRDYRKRKANFVEIGIWMGKRGALQHHDPALRVKLTLGAPAARRVGRNWTPLLRDCRPKSHFCTSSTLRPSQSARSSMKSMLWLRRKRRAAESSEDTTQKEK